MEKSNLLKKYASTYNAGLYKALNQEMSFAEYLDLVGTKPKLARNSFQYIYDMIMSKGTTTFERYRKTYTHYNFFDDLNIPIFGLDETLDTIVNFIGGAAGHFGTQNRVLLLHGPVGSSKSTIVRLIKRGLERYSRTDEGAWYTFKWVNLPSDGTDAIYTGPTDACPMNEDPLRLMPKEMRDEFLKEANENLRSQVGEDAYELRSEGELCPRCTIFMEKLLAAYDGDWNKVVEKHIRVYRRVHTETGRVGIGTFQPKDEKNQDSTELTGDLNFAKVGTFGSDSDARAFNFDGEFCIANRGVVEFIEMLKLGNEFLYDLLGVSQEHNMKPKKFSQVTVDEVVIGHTNGAEYERLSGNRYMEALRDRTNIVNVPYLTRLDDELNVYKHTYGPGRINSHHIMPHTLETAATFAILTRLKNDKETNLSLRDKAKLYNGKSLSGWTEDAVKELRDKYPDEGMTEGLSARFIQDCISNCLARYKGYVNVFHVLNEIKERVINSNIDVELKKKYLECHDLATKELQETLKSEVQKALVADENLIVRVCAQYIDNVVAYVNEEKVTNPLTKQDQEPNERLMRNIEEKIDIPEQGADAFRQSIASFMGTLHARKKEFRWDSNPKLREALEAYVFETTKDTIKLGSLSSEASVCDPELQEKIDAIKTRLIKQYGYNEQSATDVLDYVSSIFAK